MARPLTPYGKMIRKLRIDFDVTAAQFALDIGVTRAYVSATETGKKCPSLGFVRRVIDFFAARDVEPHYIIEAAALSQRVFTVRPECAEDAKVMMALLTILPKLPARDKVGLTEELMELWPE
jgi:predicted transcriptional regulator